jgi:hypothetical protein
MVLMNFYTNCQRYYFLASLAQGALVGAVFDPSVLWDPPGVAHGALVGGMPVDGTDCFAHGAAVC